MPHRVIKITFRRDYYDSRSRGKNEISSNSQYSHRALREKHPKLKMNKTTTKISVFYKNNN